MYLSLSPIHYIHVERLRLVLQIKTDGGLRGHAQDFNLLIPPAAQRGEFYKMKFVDWRCPLLPILFFHAF